MKMYFATTANGRSETKAVGDTFTEPILMTGRKCLTSKKVTLRIIFFSSNLFV